MGNCNFKQEIETNTSIFFNEFFIKKIKLFILKTILKLFPKQTLTLCMLLEEEDLAEYTHI